MKSNINKLISIPSNMKIEEFKALHFSSDLINQIKLELEANLDPTDKFSDEALYTYRYCLKNEIIKNLITYFYTNPYPDHIYFRTDNGIAFTANFLRWLERIGINEIRNILIKNKELSAHQISKFLMEYSKGCLPDNK